MEFFHEEGEIGIFDSEAGQCYRQSDRGEECFQTFHCFECVGTVVACGGYVEHPVAELRYFPRLVVGHESHPCGEHHC